MASEPQPPAVQEGADIDGPTLPTNAEDRKAAAAMSNLEGRGGDEDEDDKHAAAKTKAVDTEALGKAMKSLNVDEKGEAKKGDGGKKVKVEAADVTLLVDQLDLSKIKATELLKAHEGDAVKAMTAFVTAAV